MADLYAVLDVQSCSRYVLNRPPSETEVVG